MLLSICGCAYSRKEIIVESRAHINSFVYEINYQKFHRDSSEVSFEIELNKTDLFELFKIDSYFIEKYNDDTILFFKENNVNSSYFALMFTDTINNNYKYKCLAVEIYYNLLEKDIIIDFPFYVLDNILVLYESVFTINCSFDYILNFYSRISNVVEEQGSDYIIVKSYLDRKLVDDKIKIQKESENTIRVSHL